jgi:very-short-patch-repair endonuclease
MCAPSLGQADLLCPYDTSDEVLKVEKKQRLGPIERILASVLEHACMLGAFRFQAKVLKHWKGGVDFYCPSTRLVIQC